jgi:hypothetical protein
MRGSSLHFLVIKGRLRLEFVFQFLFWFQVVVFHPHLLRGQAVAPAAGGRTIHGVVKSGNMPIPGAGVSAANAATKEQVNTSTDVDGSYWLRIPADGRYTVRVQMAAFAASAQEVVLDATHPGCRRILNWCCCRGHARRAPAENSGGRMRADAASRVFPCFRVKRGRIRAVVQ